MNEAKNKSDFGKVFLWAIVLGGTGLLSSMPSLTKAEKPSENQLRSHFIDASSDRAKLDMLYYCEAMAVLLIGAGIIKKRDAGFSASKRAVCPTWTKF